MKDERIYTWQNFVAGGIAGVASRTLTSPLDVVKILSQVGTRTTSRGFLASFGQLYREEGLRAFWKGNSIACLRLFPYNAIQFAAFERLKIGFAEPDGRLLDVNALIAGAFAGIIATVITYPGDMVKTRLTASHADRTKGKYRGMFHAFRTIAREEGLRAFYKGLFTSVIGVIPFAGCTFMAYELLGNLWNKPRSQMSHLENFLNGCLAASFAQTFSFPFDTVRKKLQAQSRAVTPEMRPDVEFSGMVDAFIQTVRKHGVFGLWRGTTANLIKVAPYAGVVFATFEASKRFFLWQNGYTTSPWSNTPRPGVNQSLNPDQIKAIFSKKN